VAGGGVATGRLPSTTSTSSGPDAHRPEPGTALAAGVTVKFLCFVRSIFRMTP
jgi:hypothetical protein